MSARPVIPQEPDALPARAILLVALGGLAVGALALASVTWIRAANDAPHAGAQGTPPRAPQELGIVDQAPFGEPGPREAMQRERERLERWGWSNDTQRLELVPIDVAIDVVVDRYQRGEPPLRRVEAPMDAAPEREAVP